MSESPAVARSLAALELAIERAGGQSALARAIGKSQGHVWHWVKVAKRAPAEAVLAIETATGVSRSELRPDVYPTSNTAPAEIQMRPAAEADEIEIDEDELLRAQWYALLGEMLAQAPDEAFLARLAALTGDDSELGGHVAALAKTAQRTTVEQVREEFHDLFIGLSQGELLPYASYYLTGFLHEKPLATLRGAMAELGIVRAATRPEPEDHIASLCETMAGLIVGAFGKPATLATQRAFFAAHIAPWAEKFFADLAAAKSARLYMPVGQIGRIFIEIENAAFAMDEGDQLYEPNNG
jgi:TorA maturation chaperone TorD